jgi:hypothetical protein
VSLFINTTRAISLGNVGLNLPLHTQHKERVGGCDEGNPNDSIRQLVVGRIEGGISNVYKLGDQVGWYLGTSVHR